MKSFFNIVIFVFAVCSFFSTARAVQLDWSGQFWFDNHFLHNYMLDRSRPSYDADPEFINAGGSYVPGAGSRNAVWYTAFFKLNPKVIVNDSINIKSELHIGDPIFGFLGRSFPTGLHKSHDFVGMHRSNFTIGAQRFWASLITDFGTIEVGRAPIHWGLGALWDSGDKLFDRYQSTGDLIRLTSKFGNFWISPSINKVAVGDSVAGATDTTGNIVEGDDDVTDYSVEAKYDNSEEDFELGAKWVRRNGNVSQRSIYFNSDNTGSTRINFNVFDFYVRKRWSRFSVGAEMPFFTGDIGGVDNSAQEFDYKSFAVIGEGKYNSDQWDVLLKLGHVPGQPPTAAGDSRFRAIYLNKNYKMGLIMFKYNIFGMANNNPDTVTPASVNSPYDAPIVNANYVGIFPKFKMNSWTLKAAAIVGYAHQTATGVRDGKIRSFYNYNKRKFYQSTGDQGSFLGKEFDFGVDFQWDENAVISGDVGFWFPGNYFEFTNLPFKASYEAGFLFAAQLKLGITF